LKTSYLENLGGGSFNITELPMQAQTAPIFGMITEDFDADGNLDVLMVGNDFAGEVSVGRYDAFNGLLLKGNGKGKFTPSTLAESGFAVMGDAKALVRVTNANNQPLLMATQNRGTLKSFKLSQGNFQTKPLQASDVLVLETLQNGKIRRKEVGYGSSFLSQSSRSILVSPATKKIEVVDNKGKKRVL
jgi:hypothetical protein